MTLLQKELDADAEKQITTGRYSISVTKSLNYVVCFYEEINPN